MAQMLAEVIAGHAARNPDGVAFYEGDEQLTWSAYAERSDRLAGELSRRGLAAGDRVAVLLPDGPGVHTAFLGAEKAGVVVVGIGPRAGMAELRHLLSVTGAKALLSEASYRDEDMGALVSELAREGLPLETHLVATAGLDEGDALLAGPAISPEELADRRLGPTDLFLLNSTSGTTGMPKCVTHHQDRWAYFHELAVRSGELRETDVFLSAIPAPFGFGLWTAHFTPTYLGAPTVLMRQFSPDALLEQIERHRVSVLAAVSTQFVMMLNEPSLANRDLANLRALYTGGEAVPTQRAAEFEDRTGALVLQFYGSNETGALSCTSTTDTQEARLTTAGRVIEGMRVRLYDEAGEDVTASGQGQPACRGRATSHGYFEDDAANAELYTADGWMLTGDLASIDGDGYLRVSGRVADFIIRGGKNISGPVVEQHVDTHPDISLAAAVAMPDDVFGEKVCVYAELRPGASLALEDLLAHLSAQGVGKEYFPERLEVVPELPRSSGGKVAKGALRADIARRISEEKEST